MARINKSYFLGCILSKPEIVTDGNQITAAHCYLTVARGRDTCYEPRERRRDNILIIAGDQDTMREMMTWELYDVIYVSGTIATMKDVETKVVCDNCQMVNILPKHQTLPFVYPIHAFKVRSCKDKQEATDFVFAHREISNQVTLAGRLTENPKKVPNGEAEILSYPIIVERSFYIKNDENVKDNRFDLLNVKSYNANAAKDKARIKKSSLVYIDGCVQIRVHSKKSRCTCKYCGAENFSYRAKDFEIVPYKNGVDYMDKYETDESIRIKVAEEMRAVEEALKAEIDELGLTSI